MSISQSIESQSPAETVAAARLLAAQLAPGDIIALHGELGAGKTCFVQGLADGLGLEVTVTSPTYTLVHEYGPSATLVHMDLYRLRSPDEVFTLGLEDYLEGPAILAIEWPERAADALPPATWSVRIESGMNEADRSIRICPRI